MAKIGARSGKSPKFGAQNAEDILDVSEEDDEGSIRESDDNQQDQSHYDDSESLQFSQQSNRNAAKSSIGNGTGKIEPKKENETQNDAIFVLNTGLNAPPVEEEKK